MPTSDTIWPTPGSQMPGASPDNKKVKNLLTGSRHSFYLTQAVEAERIQPGTITDSESCHSSQAAGEVCSAPCSSDGEQLPLLRSTPIASESSVRGAAIWPTPNANKNTPNTVDPADLVNSRGEPWTPGEKPHDRRTGRPVTTTLMDAIRSRSTATSETSTPPSTGDRSTSSPADSPASRFRRPGSGSGKTTPATCGHTPFAYWSSRERRWDSSRTCLDFSQAATSEPFSETWPKRGSMRNGVCWEQTMSAPRIDASGCGFWPTARARDQHTYAKCKRGANSPGGTPLTVAATEWDSARGQSTPQTWPSPDAAAMNVGADPKNHYARIQRARDEGKHPHSGNVLGIVAQTQGQTPGSLNPTWVEWLMGWPRGWTDSAHSVTDRCLRQWLQRSRTWLDRLE